MQGQSGESKKYALRLFDCILKLEPRDQARERPWYSIQTDEYIPIP